MSQVYFSPSTTTFFRTDTHGVPGTEGCLMPSDVVKVSLVVFEAMVKARSQGQRVIAKFNGQPTVAAATVGWPLNLAITRWPCDRAFTIASNTTSETFTTSEGIRQPSVPGTPCVSVRKKVVVDGLKYT